MLEKINVLLSQKPGITGGGKNLKPSIGIDICLPLFPQLKNAFFLLAFKKYVESQQNFDNQLFLELTEFSILLSFLIIFSQYLCFSVSLFIVPIFILGWERKVAILTAERVTMFQA